jgi:hypothetical protein
MLKLETRAAPGCLRGDLERAETKARRSAVPVAFWPPLPRCDHDAARHVTTVLAMTTVMAMTIVMAITTMGRCTWPSILLHRCEISAESGFDGTSRSRCSLKIMTND